MALMRGWIFQETAFGPFDESAAHQLMTMFRQRGLALRKLHYEATHEATQGKEPKELRKKYNKPYESAVREYFDALRYLFKILNRRGYHEAVNYQDNNGLSVKNLETIGDIVNDSDGLVEFLSQESPRPCTVVWKDAAPGIIRPCTLLCSLGWGGEDGSVMLVMVSQETGCPPKLVEEAMNDEKISPDLGADPGDEFWHPAVIFASSEEKYAAYAPEFKQLLCSAQHQRLKDASEFLGLFDESIIAAASSTELTVESDRPDAITQVRETGGGGSMSEREKERERSGSYSNPCPSSVVIRWRGPSSNPSPTRTSLLSKRRGGRRRRRRCGWQKRSRRSSGLTRRASSGQLWRRMWHD